MLSFFQKWRIVLILILLLALTFTLGFSFGRQESAVLSFSATDNLNIINNEIASSSEPIDMEPFWKVWRLLDEKYVETYGQPASTTAQDRVWGAIQGMTDSLGDPYTVFMPPEDSKDFKQDISGNFEGIGMEIGIKEGTLTVVSPLKGSPAEKAGLKTGDKIITIDGKSASKFSTDEAVKAIRGPKDTVVKITVLREGNSQPLSFEVTRALIDLPSVETEIKDNVFVIKLYNFYGKSSPQFNAALKEFIKAKKSRLIIDLRGNPGGYLEAAVDMASWFLPLGKPIVREDFGPDSDQPQIVYRSKGYDIFNDKLKLVILVDEGSASASEILAGALQEHGKAKLVGEKTFGKGSVQELLSVTDDTSLKVTIAKWLTPNGKSISDGGLTPDFEVKITEEDIKAGRDPQMDKAIEVLHME